MPRHHKVHELLSADELASLETFAREPGRTVDECHEWLLAAGFTLSRGAVGNWKQMLDEQITAERFSRNSDLARTITEALKGGSFDAVAEATCAQLTQVVFEQSTLLEAGGELDPLDIQRMTRSLANLVGSKAGLVKIMAEKFDREMQSAQKKKPDGMISPEDIAKARKVIFGT